MIRELHMPASVLAAHLRVRFVCVVLSVGVLASATRTGMAAPVEVATPQAWHVHSPYTSLSKTRQLLDAIGFEVLSAYAAPITPMRSGGLADRPGTQIGRTFTRLLLDGATRLVEVVIAANPSGGYEIYVTGSEVREGRIEPNPDLPAIQAGIEKLADTLAP